MKLAPPTAKSQLPRKAGAKPAPATTARAVEIGDAHDPLEVEADAIADRVLRMPMPAASGGDERPDARMSGASLVLRRACCSSCDSDEDDELRREPAAGQRGGTASQSLSQRIRARMSGGETLASEARSFLEPRLGVDLGGVRMHRDGEAGTLARSVGARAFTLGRHIFFGQGQHRPGKRDGMHLLAHEVAHTLQVGHVLRRSPESEAVDAVDRGDDLLEQGSALEGSVERIRYGLHVVLGDLLSAQEGLLDELGLARGLLDRTKAAANRYRKITRYLESRSTLESVLMIQWLDAALEVIALLRQCIKDIAKRDPIMGEAIGETSGKSLRRLASQAKRLREHTFFQQGEAIEAELRPLEEAEARAERKAEVDRQLAEVRREMLAYWSWQSREAIEAEVRRLQAKQIMGGRSETGVLEVQLEVLGMLANPDNFESKGSITDRARELAALVESDIDEGALAVAGVLERVGRVALDERGEVAKKAEWGKQSALEVVVEAFHQIALEQGETRMERLAPKVLLRFGDPTKVLTKFDTSERGRLVLEWLAPPKRPELQFAMSVLWADPDGVSPRSPEDARSKLLDQSRAARATSVITATGMLQGRSRLARYADSAGTRSLLIEMAYQLWLDGFSHRKVATGDLLAATLAPELSAERASVIEDGELSIDWVGDDMRVSVDPFFNAKPPAAVVPASASVWLNGVDEPLMPALKLLELEARGDRNALVWAGQEIAHGASEAGDAANDAVEWVGKAPIELGEWVFEGSMELARDTVTEYVPEEYQADALAVVSGLETAGNVVLDAAAYGSGVAVGVTKGAIDTGTGLVSLGGGALAGAGELGSDAFDGHLLEDVGVAYRQTEHTLLVTVDAVPEIAEALYGQFQEMEGRDKVFLVGKAAGVVAFEVALTVATGGTSKLTKVERLGDAAELAKAAENAGDFGDMTKVGRPLGEHVDAVDAGHRHYADADVLRKVEAELPANTEVWVDDRLGPGDVVVEYDAPGGVVDAGSVRIVTGRDASPSWIALHGATVVAVRKYAGLQGRIRKLLDELRRVLTKVDETAGSARWEAKLEVEKLPSLVDDELAKLRAARPGSRESDEIQANLEGLAEQFEHWSRVVDGDLTPGEARGLIAARATGPRFDRTIARDAIRMELGDDYVEDYEILYVGSSSGEPRIGDEYIPPGAIYSSASLDVAEDFAIRKTGRVPGEPIVTAVAIPKDRFKHARDNGFVKTKQIDDRPGKVETIFDREIVERFGEFIPIPPKGIHE